MELGLKRLLCNQLFAGYKVKKLVIVLPIFLSMNVTIMNNISIVDLINNILTMALSLETLAFNSKNLIAGLKVSTPADIAFLLLQRILCIY